MWPSGIYLRMYSFGQTQDIDASVFPNYPKIIQCWFIHDMFIFHKCVSMLTSWITSKNNFFSNLEVSYFFVKFVLVFWGSNLCTLPIIVGFNHLTMVILCPFLLTFLAVFQRFPPRQLYGVNLHYIDILLSLWLNSYNTHSYIKSLLSSWFSSLSCALCKWQRLWTLRWF